ncbi:porin [Burkholderia stagnalis]|uniref:porin n=1 Tax=Burkholderia stagnalis TaxID=1503054 RepID=UPI00075791A0|nr:porin [Burkholderia stagnalis]KVL85627.1 porin [Burkholderia stagnalis]KVL99788.1 porin [Burkholderia stagnalis]KVM12536.1 porin [Burkholderia stagnalis]
MTNVNKRRGALHRATSARTGLHAVCVAASLAGATAARAQDGVTLYGVIDEFAQYVNTGNGYTAAIGSSGQWGSRFGVKGSEDIGGGQKIEFALENGFKPNDGASANAGSMFSRQAWVGIAGAWGKVRAGRQNSPLFLDQGGQDAFGGVTQASGMDNLTPFAIRTSNTLSYMSPEFAGFRAGVYVGFGDAGGARSAGSSQQFDVTYTHGPFAAFVAGQWLKNAAATTTDRTLMAGASYELGKATVYGGFSAVKWDDLGIDTRVYGLSVKYALSPSNFLALGYAYAHDQTSQGNHADQVGLMYEYDLSKRTSFYGALSYLRNRNQAGYTLAGAANPGLPLAYPGANARGVQLGIVHRF